MGTTSMILHEFLHILEHPKATGEQKTDFETLTHL